MLVAVLSALVASCLAAPFSSDLDQYWDNFKLQYGKNYDDLQDVIRRATWEKNIAKIQDHNLRADLGEHSYTLGVNQYTDLLAEENHQLRGYKKSKINTQRPVFLPPNNAVIPEAIDWREYGYVTPVKDQGQCGSCWAFSATGSLEGQHFRKTGKLVSLSEQNLVDCSGEWGNDGCDGGLMDQAFQYIKDNEGIDTELTYPYTAVDDKCVFSKADIGATDTGMVDIESRNEKAMKEAVASVGPVSVGIDASHMSFQFYRHGVYSEEECDPDNLDHGVLVVGYGSEDGQDYWIVKNSWGESWGMNGYMKVARNADNMCGIATDSSFPLV